MGGLHACFDNSGGHYLTVAQMNRFRPKAATRPNLLNRAGRCPQKMIRRFCMSGSFGAQSTSDAVLAGLA